MKRPGAAPVDGSENVTDTRTRPVALRLARLRLAVALIAAAAISVAAGLFVPSLLGGARPDQATVARAGASLSTGLAAELGQARSALLLLAADPGAIEAVSGKGPATDARAELQAVASLVGTHVEAASIVDAKGRERLRLEGGALVPATTAPTDPGVLTATLALPAGGVYRSPAFPGPDGSPRVTIATPLVSAGHAVGLVRFDFTLTGLLAGAGSAAAGPDGYSMIVDTTSGTVLAQTRAVPSGAPSLAPVPPDQLLAEAARGAGPVLTTLVGDGWSVGYAPIAAAVPGFDGWAAAVAISAPAPGPPILPLAALGLAVLALIALIAWTSRLVLTPTAELERSRTNLAVALEEAQQDALHDSVTGLGNHRAFHEELERQLATSRRHGVPVALVLLDLDDFKQVNDTSGHAAGDAVLARVGTFLRTRTRGGDAAFRIGGDEFAIVMPHTDAEGALVGAQRMLGMSLEPVAGAGVDSTPSARRGISFSAGVSAVPALAAGRAELYAQADAALLWCKRHGRTSVAIYDAAKHTLETEIATAELSQAVARVAAEGLLGAVFQPVVDLATGAVTGFEGLIRPAASSGFEDAIGLFGAAERCGRTVELDQACLRTVAVAAARIPADRAICMNLSPRSLEAPEFSAAALRREVERAGLQPDRVVIELTERQPVDDIQVLRTNLLACQRVGLRIAIDDVGTGTASLRLLSQVRFDIVKIDLSLVLGGAARESAVAVLRSVTELAKRWGSTVVAEGIETTEQLRVARSLGMVAAQGYLLGRPSDDVTVESVDLEALLATESSRAAWAAIRVGSA